MTADIVVYGDSPSALSAALELAISSQDVLLVGPVAHVGGMMVEGLGHQDVDWRSGDGDPIGGLTSEFFLRIGEAYAPGSGKRRFDFEAKVAQRVINEWLEEHKVRQMRNARLVEGTQAVEKSAGRINAIKLEDGTRVAGKVFIDGTVEGDLMAAAGVTHTYGREGNAVYGENFGGVINPTKKDQFQVKIDPFVVPGNPSSGVIFGVQNEGVGEHGAGDKAAMGFCLRLPLTKNPSNKVPITAPDDYDARDYEIYRRYLVAGGMNDWLNGPGNVDKNPTKKLFDLGSWHDLSGNFYGRNHEYPIADAAGREAIYREHQQYTQGLIYWLSNDPAVPQAIRDEWSRWGLPADEFTDNGGWPRRLYVRCARRMISDYVITEADVRRRPVGLVTPRPMVTDSVGMCYWPIDFHNARTVIRDGAVYNEGAYFDLTNYRPFGIPYRSIVPKRSDCVNLLVPSALSSSYSGYGALRLEWTFMVLGQSAAVAAAMAVEGNVAVQDVAYDELKKRLLTRGQRLTPEDSAVGIIIDNADVEGISITGAWETHVEPRSDLGGWLHDGNQGQGSKSVRFTPDIPESGVYSVQARWKSDEKNASAVPMEIAHADGTAKPVVNQREKGNRWNVLGSYEFKVGTSGFVSIGNEGADGRVVVDAVRFVRVE
ncbi:FAD-dependent oxidoreductase [Phragmitibacter flavus]|uniref:FAD-dependent oxidoreductase n=1 Tax=Phragmitibacter flavus TaxID=2576071 RepID=UPI00140769F0|nr:FAD-dependent oxidoreductase [Phragmitibacter flavus]